MDYAALEDANGREWGKERERKGGGGELKRLRVKCLARGMFQRLVESVFATEDNNFKGGDGGEGPLFAPFDWTSSTVLIAFMLFFRFVPASLSDRTPRTPLCPYFFSPISRRCRIGRIRKIDQRNFLGLCFLPSFPFFSNLLYKCWKRKENFIWETRISSSNCRVKIIFNISYYF